MPVIEVKMWEGRNSLQKKKLIEGITEVTMDATGCEKEAVQVLIEEYKRENWGISGKQSSE